MNLQEENKRLKKDLEAARVIIDKLTDPGDPVEIFLLKYFAWFGKYTFDRHDYVLRRDIEKLLERYGKEDLEELFQSVRKINVNKPRMRHFHQGIDDIRRKYARKAQDAQDTLDAIEKARNLELEKQAIVQAGGRPKCGLCKTPMMFNLKENKFWCPPCELRKRTSGQDQDNKSMGAGK